MRSTLFKLLLVAVFLLGFMVSDAQAQGGGSADDEIEVLMQFTGMVEVLEEDLIVVDGYEIAPAGIFSPSDLEIGDLVMVTGYLLDDGDTIQVVSLQLITDSDGDGIHDIIDNCVEVANEDQADADLDGVGDLCDPDLLDSDGDTIPDALDNCVEVANTDQADADEDGIGDLCDPDLLDSDEDTIPDALDNCVEVANTDQADADEDGIGDLCDPDLLDSDGDTIPDALDNCVEVANTDQADADEDGIGDLCDDGDDSEDDACDRPGHPVATTLANEFDVPYETIMGWHCDGFGFGEIARALLLAEAAGDSENGETPSVEEILQMKADGQGWGQIVAQYDVHPGDLAPGRVISGGNKNDEEDPGEDTGMTTLDVPVPSAGPGNSANAPGQQGRETNGAPGNSGNAPGQSGETPGNSGNAPGQSGETPGNSGNAPGQSGETPGNSGNAPGQGGETPGNSGNAPGQSGDAPGNSGNASGQSGETPGNSGNAPGHNKDGNNGNGRG